LWHTRPASTKFCPNRLFQDSHQFPLLPRSINFGADFSWSFLCCSQWRMNPSVTLKSKGLASQPACPRCSNEYVKRVSRVGLGEHLISLFYIYPFRCQLCAHRFKVLQRGVTYTKIEEDRREHKRLPAKFPITFTVRGGDASGSTVDISMGGCSFHAESRLVKGIILRIELQLPDEIPPVKISAAVIRSVRTRRVSVKFLRIEHAERERLHGFVRSLMLSQ
jgi:hypothetical protein